jgi:hypothetical protein
MYEYVPYKVTQKGGGSYPLCWKFIPPGNSDKVLARLPSSLPSGFHFKNLKFVTTNQTEISYDSTATANGITLTLPGGDDGTDYSLHAVNDSGNGHWKQIGRVDVMTRSLKTFNVVIVPVEADIPENEITQIQTNLNAIYSPYGISWTVTVDNEFNNNVNEIQAIIPNYQLSVGDAFLREYSPHQVLLQSLYKEQVEYNNEKSVVFIFRKLPIASKGELNEVAKLGEMPIGRQWGYLFEGGFDAHTLAHELGHGMFDLRHTFASDACGESKQGLTKSNLMDYSDGDSMVCKQWEYMHNNAIIGKIFQDDADGELKGTSTAEQITNVIEMIRCGYSKPHAKVAFKKDTWRWFSEKELVSNFKGLYDGVTYDMIYVELLNEDSITLPPNVIFVDDVKLSKFDLGSLIIKVDKNHTQALADYLKPSAADYSNQQQAFICNIVKYFKEKIYSRGKVIEFLKTSSQCMFEGLTQDLRIDLLNLINDGTNIPEAVERVVIDIIRTTPFDQIDYLFQHLSSDGLMTYFETAINDFGGEDNYTRYNIELLNLFH